MIRSPGVAASIAAWIVGCPWGRGSVLCPNGYSNGVDRLLAVGCSDDQFAATCGRASVLSLLLYAACRQAIRYGASDERVAPAHTRQCMTYAIASDKGNGSLRGTKTIVAGDGLLVERSRCGRRPEYP